MPADLTREDLAAFVALWPRAYVPFGLVTESTLQVLKALRELAQDGGVLIMPSPGNAIAPPAAPVILTDDDIPF